MKKTIKYLFGCLGLGLWISAAIAQSSPIPMLESSANHILAELKAKQSHLKTDPQIINQAIESYLLPHVDIEGMSRSVLGREIWSAASPDQKQAFSRVFTKLIIHTYASPLAEYSGETVHFMPLRGEAEGRFIRVNSLINRPNGQQIGLSYNLVFKSGSWKIYDLSVEGISLLQSFKLQFADILKLGSMKDLIRQMQANQTMG